MLRSSSSEKAVALLEELIGTESYTHEGQDRCADLLLAYLQDQGVEDVRKVLYPDGASLSTVSPRPSNVIGYIGKRPPDQVKRNLLVTGHFDTVGPHHEYATRGIDPLALRTPHRLHPHFVAGLGVGDMKGPIVSALLAIDGLREKLSEDQGVTVMFVSNEEEQSQGFHAAQEDDLLKHVNEALSLEIQVGSTLDQAPVLLAGRPGRVELQINFSGKSSHTGAVTGKDDGLYVFSAFSKALNLVRTIPLEEDPRDYPHTLIGNMRRSLFAALQGFFSVENRRLLMPRASIVPTFGRLNAPGGMSMANTGYFHVDVLYSNSQLTPEAIRSAVCLALRKALPKEIYCDVLLDPDRTTPPTGPWREESGEALIREAYGIARKMLPRGNELTITYGGPTADEAIISRRKKIPVVGMPPVMTGEHTAEETLDLRSLASQSSFIQALATRPPTTA